MAEQRPIKVLMFCAMGMSSSLLENKLREAAKNAGVPLELQTITATEIARWDFKQNYVDIVIIAPQVRFKKKSVTAAAKPYNIIVHDIDPIIFGMAEGEKLFRQIVAAVQARDQGQA